MTDSSTDSAEIPVTSRSAAQPSQAVERAELEPMDPQLTDIQPGGGVVMQLELAWGKLRRCYLRTLRRGYIKKMAAKRQGDANPAPHPVLDPRDLKFYQNQPAGNWTKADDPFRWRNNIPFARAGLAELLVFSLVFFGTAIGVTAWLTLAPPGNTLQIVGWILVAACVICGGLIVWFFRDPSRDTPMLPGQVISPADGKLVEIEHLEHDPYIDGPAVKFGIFLSIFNVHMNRVPVAGKVIGLRYRKGKFLNALRPESARENEQLAVRIEEDEFPHRRMIIRQITGAIARRIVCWVKPGDQLRRGERFGMIKLGSRTELLIPAEDGLKIVAELGQTVKAGLTVFAEYSTNNTDDPSQVQSPLPPGEG